MHGERADILVWVGPKTLKSGKKHFLSFTAGERKEPRRE
jgi:hypothetical protein